MKPSAVELVVQEVETEACLKDYLDMESQPETWNGERGTSESRNVKNCKEGSHLFELEFIPIFSERNHSPWTHSSQNR